MPEIIVSRIHQILRSMSIDRLARVNELLRREIGGALYHVLKDYEVDLAAVTITHVITTRNLRSARVLVSIRDHRGERDRIISRLRRHRAEIQAIINRNMTLKYTPKLMFALDPSVERAITFSTFFRRWKVIQKCKAKTTTCFPIWMIRRGASERKADMAAVSDQRFNRPAPPRKMEALDGVLLVDKPAGPTSHDIVAAVRRNFGIKKVGHGGTLDPQATGLLILLLGKGTKLSSRFLGSDKIYEGRIRLGVTTNSQDADGEIVSESDWSGVTKEDLLEQMNALTGDIYQTPPMVSAVKVDGVPLYKRARKGEVVERKPRLVHIYSFKLIDFEPPQARFTVKCTKGTYVRTLCADIGEALGCGAHLDQLRRTASGTLKVADASLLDDILNWDKKTLEEHVIHMRKFA
jgi:tRNA pseudouridine55 synthase